MNDSSENVARHLAARAAQCPEATCVVRPAGRDAQGGWKYRSATFRELDQDSDRLARGLRELGVRPGMRIALLVRPGIDFVSLVFALLKSAAVQILIDPGLGRRNMIECLAAAQPQGFVAIPLAQAVRRLLRHRFPQSQFHVTVGRRWFWDGITLDQLRGGPWSGPELAPATADSPAAIIFTTGSTGPPKGVLYSHGNFDQQVTQLREFYGIAPGEVDLAAFPLFGLFNAALGVTTVIPAMDPSRPARARPENIVAAIRDWSVTQSFASPAVWNRVGPYCLEHGIRLPTLQRVFSAGAPVPPRVLEQMQQVIAQEGHVHTPYGATEALPVASISAREVLGDTVHLWRQGGGTCVGRRFGGIDWQIIRVVDGPIATIDRAEPLPTGEIGELIVRGPVVTRCYVTRTEANALAKIADGASFWHRMGDVGYLDAHDRFWFCGRLSHRVQTPAETLYTIPCEAIFNQHPDVFRSALVGVGPAGRQTPVIVCEPWPGRFPRGRSARQTLIEALRVLAAAHPHTRSIQHVLLHRAFPVDIRHNAKIFREKLAVWAQRQLPTLACRAAAGSA